MRWLSELSVRRSVLAWVIILSLTFLGTFFYRRLNVERFPNVDLPFVAVYTRLPGASPEEVESDVTNKIEEAVNTISGIDTLTSTSAEGFSQVAIQFVLEKDINVAAQDVRDKINGILPDLPAGIDQPVVSKLDPGAVPVLTLALSGDHSIRDLTEYADKVFKRQLDGTPGVGSVDIVGGQARQINVWIDPSRLNAYGISATSIIQALQTQNIQVPGGNIDQGTQRLTLRTLGRVDSIAELEQLVVANRGGVPVKLADVARVEDGAAEPKTIASLNGQPAVSLNIVKQSGSNTLNVVRDVKARLAGLTASLPPGYRLKIVSDQSVFVEASTRAVQEHLMVGSLLAAVVVLLFLRDVRATVIAAIAIPTSLISTFTFLNAMGLTLNIVTLLALALVVGIVIDDAIVVLENIYRFIREKKMAPFQAAIEATREVGGAVTSTTMSLIAVFLPLAFMGGIVGRFMRSFGYTMAFSIAVSLLVSFTLTPMLSSRWLKGSKPGAPTGGEARGGRIYMALENGYRWLLQRALRRRWVVAVLSLLVLFSMAPLGIAVNKNFFPDEDESQFEAIIRAPEGWSLQTAEQLANQMSTEMRRLPGVDYTMVTVAADPLQTPNRANIYAHMVDVDKRTVTQADIVNRVRSEILPRYGYLGLQTQVGPVNAFGGGGTFQPIDYVVGGPDLAVLTRVADQGQAILRKIPGVVDVRSSLITGKPQLGITVDRARAADLGVSVANAASALNAMVAGQKAGTYAELGQQYDIVVRADAPYRDMGSLSRLQVGSTTQGVVPLEQLVQINAGVGPSTIDHYNRRRRVELTANLLPGASQSAVLSQLDREMHKLRLSSDYTVAFAGQAAEQGRQAQAFMTAFGLSFVFMYLILAAQFESWLHPVTILLSLPLTVPFALLSILFLRDSLNILSQLGILVLFGVVKKNAILQIDHANQLRAGGLARDEAILAASRDRLRPILMTTIAFVAGMIPLAISSGVGSGTNRSISSVVIGGQTLSLILTLVAIPVFYSLFDDLSKIRVVSRVVAPFLAVRARLAGLRGVPRRRAAAEPVSADLPDRIVVAGEGK